MIQLSADFSKKLRPMGKINGMNNGPLMAHSDHTKEYKAMGVDFVRFHECHAQQANCVEVPFIFPDFDADEFDEKNYIFTETDVAVAAAVEQGYEIMYRFGMGTEIHNEKTLFCVCPPDYEKWGRIVIQILKHYNEGWANGFHYNIKWCEIWNEADLTQYWPGSYDEYIKFYAVTSKMLREYDPSLKICPSGFAGVIPAKPKENATEQQIKKYESRYKFFHTFLDTVKREDLPLDCFPWHFYQPSSKGVADILKRIKEMLSIHGMEDIDLINTEWGSCSLHRGPANGLDGEINGFTWDMAQTETVKSAIGGLASMIVMQQHGNSRAAYYDPDPRSNFCGLYDYNGTPRPLFYSMIAVKMLRECEWEYETEGETDNIRICAAFNGKKAVICITCEDEACDVQLKIRNLNEANVTHYLFDETHPLTRIKKSSFAGRAINLRLAANSARVLEFEPV